jgi:hypothetical protein
MTTTQDSHAIKVATAAMSTMRGTLAVLWHPEGKVMAADAIVFDGFEYARTQSGDWWRLSDANAEGWRVPSVKVKTTERRELFTRVLLTGSREAPKGQPGMATRIDPKPDLYAGDFFYTANGCIPETFLAALTPGRYRFERCERQTVWVPAALEFVVKE